VAYCTMEIKIESTYATKAGGKTSLNQTGRKRKLKRKADAYFTEIFLGWFPKILCLPEFKYGKWE